MSIMVQAAASTMCAQVHPCAQAYMQDQTELQKVSKSVPGCA